LTIEASPMRVDRSIPFVETHHHLWELERLPYAWLAGPGDPDEEAVLGDYRMIRTNWGPERLFREFYGQNVIKSVHIEAAMSGSDPAAETAWLADVNRSHGMPNALVAFCDLRGKDAERVLDAHLEVSSLVRGVRMRATGDPTDPGFERGYAALGRRGLSYELDDPALGPDLARRHPSTQIILGHAGAPYSRDPDVFLAWSDTIGRLGEHSNIACKVSGLGMADHHWTIASIRPWVLRCIDVFGLDRTMFGTNWPVDMLYATYMQQVDAYRVLLAEAGFSDAEQQGLLHGNAERIYGI
jgi:predicted TIM-barrel fold metal-dependent hydrolase